MPMFRRPIRLPDDEDEDSHGFPALSFCGCLRRTPISVTADTFADEYAHYEEEEQFATAFHSFMPTSDMLSREPFSSLPTISSEPSSPVKLSTNDIQSMVHDDMDNQEDHPQDDKETQPELIDTMSDQDKESVTTEKDNIVQVIAVADQIVQEDDLTSQSQKAIHADQDYRPVTSTQDLFVPISAALVDAEDQDHVPMVFAQDDTPPEVLSIDAEEPLAEPSPPPSIPSSPHTTPEQPASEKDIQIKSYQRNGSNERRSSIVSTAQSLLGDKLEDFTEKLAFIKKNIIMNFESDDETEMDHEYMTTNDRYLNKNRKPPPPPPTTPVTLSHNETSIMPLGRRKSLLDVAGPSINRLVNHIGGNNGGSSSSNHTHQRSHSASSTYSPSSIFASLAGPVPDSTLRRSEKQHGPITEESLEEDEELFDFSKVVAFSKNVRAFGEDVVGNGMRMFSDVATRIRNSSKPNDGNDHYFTTDHYM